MPDYKWCETEGHWKDTRVCDNKLTIGVCRHTKVGCKPTRQMEISDEERKVRSDRMKELNNGREVVSD
jgi:hypothetical protein